LRSRSQEYQTRSNQLRKAAIEHYTENGRIYCHACEFDFSKACPKLGNGYIQIHHIKPVSYLKGQPLLISKALTNVCPLSANCHQMVHKNNPPIEIEKLKTFINVDYLYS